MATTENAVLKVQALINAPVETVWEIWTDPKHIVKWNQASADWHTSYAENDLRPGGEFLSRMEAKDGNVGFDFKGKYENVEQYKLIEYFLEDGRKVQISFEEKGNQTAVSETFDADSSHSLEMQQAGWQSILDNFKQHVETLDKFETLHFEVTIDAPVEKVYRMMLDEKSYREWSSTFSPTSHFIGSWEKGAKILFIGTDQEGNKGGMVSRIKENIPEKYVSLEHRGILQGDKEVTSGPEVEEWAGALENYTFRKEKGKTVLTVDSDSNNEFKSYFQETWPKALNKLKAICEG